MAKQRKVTYDSTYQNHPINTNPDQGYGCDTRILDAVKRTLDGSLEASSKVLAIRYDVRYPATMKVDDLSNDKFKTLQASLCKHLTRRNLKPKYTAVREQGDSNTPHYHVLLTLDGQKTQSPYKHIQKAKELAARQLGLDPKRSHGLIHVCQVPQDDRKTTDAYMLTRNDKELYDQVFYRCSYLAKVATKPNGYRELFVSKRTPSPKPKSKSHKDTSQTQTKP